MPTPQTLPPPSLLCEEMAVTKKGGEALTARLYRSPYRYTGRRVILYDASGAVVYDTGNCYDLANACANACRWLDGH